MNSRPKRKARPRSDSWPRFSNEDVVDLINAGAERVERRHHHDADENWVEAEAHIDDIGGVGPEDDEGGMGDVDDVEDTERERHAAVTAA